MSTKLVMLSPILLLLMSSGCATNTTATATKAAAEAIKLAHDERPVIVGDYCLIANGISYSERHEGDAPESEANSYDTSETIKQVKDHDLQFERVCGTPPPPTSTTKETKR